MFDDDGMDEIKQIFLEESSEGLDIMESGLLKLEAGVGDLDLINDVFRAAHSLKGGGGTFGFTEISEFTHGVETILDEMRDEVREATENTISVLLECVDCLRSMLDTIRDGGEYDTPRIQELGSKIQGLLDDPDSAKAALDTGSVSDKSSDNTPDAVGESDTQGDGCWRIDFKPFSDILSTGNEPYRIFRELDKLGALQINVQIESLPALSEIKADQCYLSWNLFLKPDSDSFDKSEIEDLFDWVQEQSDTDIYYVPEKASTIDQPLESPQTTPSLSADEGQEKIDPQEKLDQVSNKIEEVKKSVEAEDKVKEKPVAKVEKPEVKKPADSEYSSIRVSTDKIDSLLDLVGELVITQSMLARFGKEYDPELIDELRDGLAQLEQNTRELQESSMQIRMLPIKVIFSRFPRLLRDLTGKLKKKVKLEVEGETTELDKIVMEKIGDPLVHLVRNSLDHGIEIPEIRRNAGKTEVGTLKLVAYQEARNIVIQVIDDGAGLNKKRILEKAISNGLVNKDDNLSDDQINNLIFAPGFSTADVVSDISGRGVGMDVVKRNIQDIGGKVEVISEEGVGSTFTIRLPLTLAILDGQLVKSGTEIYVVPVLSIIESVLIDSKNLSLIANDQLVYHFREEYIMMSDLGKYGGFNGSCQVRDLSLLDNHILVVCECDGSKFGIIVDELSDQQQVVIKSLDVNYKDISGLSGGTILGDGKVALILDPVELRSSCLGGHGHDQNHARESA